MESKEITPSLETEIPLSEEEILLSSEQITLLLDLRSTLIHKINEQLVEIPLSGVIINKDFEVNNSLLQLRMESSSSELREGSLSILRRLLFQEVSR